MITSVERTYSDLGQLVSETQAYDDPYTVSYTYTLSGARETVTYPSGGVLEYAALDGLDRPTQVDFDGSPLVELEYAGRRLRRLEFFSDDLVGMPVMTLDVGHDEYGRPTACRWRGMGEADVIDDFRAAYDENGNPLYENAELGPLPQYGMPAPYSPGHAAASSTRQSRGDWTAERSASSPGAFTFDGVDRLKTAVSGHTLDGGGQIAGGDASLTLGWGLDDLGARAGMSQNIAVYAGTHGLTNQLTTEVIDADGLLPGGGPLTPRTANFVYDDAGNLLTAKLTTGAKYLYHYDVYSQLVKVQSLGTATVNPDGSYTGTLGAVIATYVYDALGRRINESLSGVGWQTRYLYDGWRVLEDRVVGAPGDVFRRYFWGTQELDELWAFDAADSSSMDWERYFCTRDLRHNIRAIVYYDPAGGESAMMGGGGSAGQPEGEAAPQGLPGEPEPIGGAELFVLSIPESPDPLEEWPPLIVEGESAEPIGPEEPLGPPEGIPGQPAGPEGGGGGASAMSGGEDPGTKVLERYVYKPHGERLALNAAGTAGVADDNPNNVPFVAYPTCSFGFQGQRHDFLTFQMYYKCRYYDPLLNRFTQHDPKGYVDGMNMYQAFASNPATFTDPMGTDVGVTSRRYRTSVEGTPVWAVDYTAMEDGAGLGLGGLLYQIFTVNALRGATGFVCRELLGVHFVHIVESIPLGTEYFSYTEDDRLLKFLDTTIETQRQILQEAYIAGRDVQNLRQGITVLGTAAVALPVAAAAAPVATTAFGTSFVGSVTGGAVTGAVSLGPGSAFGEWIAGGTREEIIAAGKKGATWGAGGGAIFGGLAPFDVPLTGPNAFWRTLPAAEGAVAAEAAAMELAATSRVAPLQAAESAEQAALLRPYGGPGGGHHLPAQAAFRGAAGYDPNAALAIPNAEMARLGVQHLQLVTPSQRALYTAFARTGRPLTWEVAEAIETEALIRGGMQPGMARATVQKAIQSLKDAGVSGPTRIPWSRQ